MCPHSPRLALSSSSFLRSCRLMFSNSAFLISCHAWNTSRCCSIPESMQGHGYLPNENPDSPEKNSMVPSLSFYLSG